MYTVTTTFGDIKINYIITKWNKYYISVRGGAHPAKHSNQ